MRKLLILLFCIAAKADELNLDDRFKELSKYKSTKQEQVYQLPTLTAKDSITDVEQKYLGYQMDKLMKNAQEGNGDVKSAYIIYEKTSKPVKMNFLQLESSINYDLPTGRAILKSKLERFEFKATYSTFTSYNDAALSYHIDESKKFQTGLKYINDGDIKQLLFLEREF